MPSIQTLLAPQSLTETVSQVAATSDWLTMLFGVQPSGKNVIFEGHGRNGYYHIYDHVRKVAKGRAPGQAAGRRAPNIMGRVDFTYPRMHDSVSLLGEWLHNLALITNPAVRDLAGADMIKRQTNTLGELASNWRKTQLIGALRDSLYVGTSGDDTYFSFTQTNTGPQINYQMPAGNKGQLNMLGAGNIINATWANPTTDIPLHLMLINAAFQRLCGGHLAACICGSSIWNDVINNEHVAAVHGSANAPFKSFGREALEPELAKTMKNVYRATLNVMPDVDWYITDEGIEVGAPGAETFEKIVGDNQVAFIGFVPGDRVIACYEGSEPIAEYDGGPEDVKVGLNSWSVKRSNPTCTDIFVLDNALIVDYIPKAKAYATVRF